VKKYIVDDVLSAMPWYGAPPELDIATILKFPPNALDRTLMTMVNGGAIASRDDEP
jgi:hypothetical protein